MQASEARNETRLPRVVLQKSAELKAKYGGPVNPAPNEPENPDQPVAPVAPAGTAAESPAAPDADPRKSDPAYWEQRFNVTSGVLRAARDDHKVQVQALNQRIAELMEENNELRAAKVASTPVDLGRFYTPEQIEEMGEDVARTQIEAIEKVIRAELTQVLETQVKPLREAQQHKAQEAKADAQAAFLDKLAELVPDYVEVDTPETGFHDWLKTFTDDGIERQEILNRHVAAGSAEKVAKVFQDFKQTVKRPVPPITPNGTGATPTTTVTPNANAGLTEPTPAEMKDYFKRAALGKVQEKERVEFEARMKLMTG